MHVLCVRFIGYVLGVCLAGWLVGCLLACSGLAFFYLVLRPDDISLWQNNFPSSILCRNVGIGRCTQWDGQSTQWLGGQMHTVAGWGDVYSGGTGWCTQWDGETYTIGRGGVRNGMEKCTQW